MSTPRHLERTDWIVSAGIALATVGTALLVVPLPPSRPALPRPFSPAVVFCPEPLFSSAGSPASGLLWSPALIALPGPYLGGKQEMPDLIKPAREMPRAPEMLLPLDAVAGELFRDAESAPRAISRLKSAGEQLSVPSVKSAAPDRELTLKSKTADGEGLPVELDADLQTAGVDLAPLPLDQWSRSGRSGEARAFVRFDAHGQAVLVLLESSSADPDFNGELVRGLYRCRVAAGRGPVEGRIRIGGHRSSGRLDRQ